MYRTEFELNEVPLDIRQYFEEFESECGAPWERVVEVAERVQAHWLGTEQEKAKAAKGAHGSTSVIETGQYNTYRTASWQPGCNCPGLDGDHPGSACADEDNWPRAPCTVLDPFAGSGTTGMVAALLGQDSIGIELNPEYAEMARRRIANGCSLWATVRIEPPPGGARLAEEGEGL